MPRRTLIIRNIDGIQGDDLKIALGDLESNPNAPREFNELISLVQSSDPIDRHQLNQAITLFKQQQVRDYIYETVKANTGIHTIYHLNGVEDNGNINQNHVDFITEKLATIPPNTYFDVLYFGGGHGDPVHGMSNLNRHQLQKVADVLQSRNAKFSAIVLGSCFSTAYAGFYQPLLKNDGIMISNSLECGGDNNFHQVLEWQKGQRQEFYSAEDIQRSIKISRDARSAVRRVLEGTVPQGEKLREEYNALLNTYKERAREQEPLSTPNRIYELGGDLFNDDLDQLIIKLQTARQPLNAGTIEGILIEFPLLDEHIKAISVKRNSQQIFTALQNSLKATSTSLALATKNSITMANFDDTNEMPPNAGEDFQANYALVCEQVRYTNCFETINKVSDNFDGVSAKRQFNVLFAQATISREPVIVNTAPIHNQEHQQPQVRAERLSQKIDEILDDLAIKIQTIGKHHLKAKHITEHLLENLRQRKNDAFNEATPQSLETFAQQTRDLIKEATPELQRDLAWGDFLSNITKEIVNAITTAIAYTLTVGTWKHQGFFTLKPSNAVTITKELEDSVQKEIHPNLMMGWSS